MGQSVYDTDSPFLELEDLLQGSCCCVIPHCYSLLEMRLKKWLTYKVHLGGPIELGSELGEQWFPKEPLAGIDSNWLQNAWTYNLFGQMKMRLDWLNIFNCQFLFCN